MGWVDFYKLLRKYRGDITQATPGERRMAAHNNPHQPARSFDIALHKYYKEHGTP